MVGNNIRKLRILQNLTQEDIAAIVGCSFKSVSAWECGRREPRNSVLVKLAQRFNVSVDYLLGLK